MTQTTTGRPAGESAAPRKQRAQITAKTLRTDRWWIGPLVTFLGLTAFVIYGFWAIFEGHHFARPSYVAPFSAPCLAAISCPEEARFLGFAPFGDWYTLPPGLLILGLPAGFRLTCYYYRKAYYRSFWLSPPACAVREPHSRYTGETRFPLILQNIHRYFFYAAVIIAIILTYEAVMSFRHADGSWGHVGLGSILLSVNAVLIVLYTISCHSCRHIVAGRLNHFSRHPLRYKAWTFVSRLNARHMQLAWASLISIVIADLYVRLVAQGVINFPYA